MADFNPWSAEHWDPVAQANYIRSKGMKRASIRAAEAGTQPHGPRPASAMLKALKHKKHVELVRGIVHRRNATRGVFISAHMNLGVDASIDTKVSNVAFDFGFAMDVLLDREIDIILNPGELSFAVRFLMGFDESMNGFGATYNFDPIRFDLGVSPADPIVFTREKAIGPFVFGLGVSETASTGNERIMLPVTFGLGFDQHASRLTDFNIPVAFSLGFLAAARPETGLTASMALGFTEAVTSFERARELSAAFALGFSERAVLGDTIPIDAHFDIGFSIAQSFGNEVHIAAAPTLGFTEAASIYRARELAAAFSLGIAQATAQPVLPITAHAALGFDHSTSTSEFLNIISHHDLGLSFVGVPLTQPTVVITASEALGFSMSAAVDRYANPISAHSLGFNLGAFVSGDRELPSDLHIGFDMAVNVVMPFNITVNMVMGFEEQTQPYIPFPLDPISFDVGPSISKADIPKFSPLVIQTSNFYNQTTTSTTITFSGCALGPSLSQPKAIVVTATHGNNNQTLLGLDIGGRPASFVAGQTISNTRHSETWMTIVDGSVTSGDVVLHLSGAEAGASIVVDALTGTPSGVTDFREVAVGATSYASQTLSVKAGGYFIGIAPHSNNVNVAWAAASVSLNNLTSMLGFFTNSGLYQVRNSIGNLFPADGTFTTGAMTSVGTQQPYVYMLVLEPGLTPTYVAAAAALGFDMAASVSTTLETVMSASAALGFDMSATLTGGLTSAPSLGFSMAATLTTTPTNAMNTTFIGSQSSATGTSFTGFNIGAADANGWCVVCLYYGSSGIRLPTAVTIGGVAATRAVRAATVTSRCVDIWYANVTSGGTINITVAYGGNTNNGAVGVYMMSGPLDTASIQTHSTSGSGPYQPVYTITKPGTAGFAGDCTASGTVTTFTEPAAADFAANHATATTYRYTAGHSGPLSTATWNVNITNASGLTNWISAVFPPL